MTKNMTVGDEEYRIIVDSLQRKVKIIKDSSSDKDFFIGMANFYKYLIGNEKLEFIIEMLGFTYNEDRVKINKLASEILKETTDAFKKILASIKNEKLVDLEDLKLVEDYYAGRLKNVNEETAKKINYPTDQIIRAVREYLSWINGKTESLSGEPFELSLEQAVEQLAMVIFESGYKDIVKDYVTTQSFDGKERISDFKVSESSKKYEVLKNEVNSKDSTLIWKAFQNVQLVDICIYDFEAERARLRQTNSTASLMNFNGLVDEMSYIIKDGHQLGRNPLIFKRNDYASYLDRIYDKILDVLAYLHLLSNSGAEIKETKSISEDNKASFIDKTIVNDPQSMPKSGNLLANSGDWIIRKPSVGNEIEVYYRDHKPLLVSHSSKWLKVFTKYIDLTRLSVVEICTYWNTAGGAWKKKGKRADDKRIPVIHRQIKDGLASLPVIVEFKQTKGFESGSYVFSSKPSSK